MPKEGEQEFYTWSKVTYVGGRRTRVVYIVLGHLCLREENQSFIHCLRSPMSEGGEPDLYIVLGHLCLREENQSFIPCLRSPMPEGGEPAFYTLS